MSDAYALRPPGIDAWTDAQRVAVTSDASVMEVRGSLHAGKTSVIAARAARQAATGEASVYVLTGTAIGARHLNTVLTTMGAKAVSVTTVPQRAARLLRRYGDATGRDDWTLMTADESRECIARILKEMGYKDLSQASYDVWREVMARTVQVDQSTETPVDVSPSFPLEAEALRDVIDTYRVRLRDTHTLDRPHMLQRTVECLSGAASTGPRSDAVHLFVDDAENLTPIEGAFLQCLQPVALTVAVNPAACVTGGRGGDPHGASSLLEAMASRRDSDVTSVQLRETETYISRPAATATRYLDRSVEKQSSHADCDIDGVSAFVADGETEERERIAHAIRRWTTGEEGAESVGSDRFSPAQVAVLMPDNEQVEMMVTALADLDIPVHVPGRGNETLQDMLAYLFVLANPHDDVRLFQIINTPARGIGRTTQARLRTYAAENGLSAWSAIEQADEEKALTSRARRVLLAFRDLMAPLVKRSETASAADLARSLVDETELLTSVTRGQTREQIEREERVERFIRRLPEEKGREALLRFLDRDALGQANEGGEGRVVVATPETALDMHRQVVFVGALNEGVWPASHTVRSDALLMNERRRLAVAVARAQDRAILSCATSRGTGRRAEPTARSRFWEEIEAMGMLPLADLGRGEEGEKRRDYRTSLRAKQSDATATPRPTDDQAAAIRPGQRVEHPTLGQGTVRDVQDDGTTRVAEVAFEERGTKRLNLKYAPLHLV